MDFAWLELRVPPPAVALVLAMPMWLASTRMEPAAVPYAARTSAAALIAAAGVAVGLSAVVLFRRRATTINPVRPSETSSLVTTGIHTLSRNPLYLSLLLYLATWCAFLARLPLLLALPLFMLYISRFQIAPEERTLAAQFADEFASCRARVRRWL